MFLHSRALSQMALIFFIFFICFIILVSIKFGSNSSLKFSLSSPFNFQSIPISLINIPIDAENEQTLLEPYSIWCHNTVDRLDSEQYLPQSPFIQAPYMNSSKLNRLSYRYSLWKSSPLLPRRLSPCEHNLLMRLLKVIQRIFFKYNITYMLYDGSLLGSWRHHDIIPWDDDIDIIVSAEDKFRFFEILQSMNETLVQYHVSLHSKTKQEFFKIFFKNSPSAGEYSWNFPFIDFFFYDKNTTHIWPLSDPETATNREYTFPLVMRPFGQLWLPAPRKPEKLFKFNPYDECNGHYYDHRNERGLEEIKRKCNELKDIYPFVERNIQSTSIEVLKTNDTIIHTVIYKYFK